MINNSLHLLYLYLRINNSLHLLYLYLRISYNFDFSFISETTEIFIELIISFVNKLVRDQVKKLSLCRKLKFSNPNFFPTQSQTRYFFKRVFFWPQDMIGFLRSNLGIFLLRKFGVVWVYIDLPGVVIWQHIHLSTLHSFWEKGWQDSSCFLGLRIIECSNSSDLLEWGPGAIQTGNITLIASNHL